uniref:Peptidase S1 domain-containing protein n=1 Tax=Coccolithus braarudii TaxID=221442 RepID=A0A7S0KZ03_9EUKA
MAPPSGGSINFPPPPPPPPPTPPPPPLTSHECWPKDEDQELACRTDNTYFRIVGGCAFNEPREFPFLASLQAGGRSHFCGGTVVSPRWVLTAAHCMYTAAFVIKLGLNDKTQEDACVHPHQVKRVVIHPQYNRDTMENDIALIEMTADTIYKPAEVYNLFEFAPSLFDQVGSLAVVAGWGTTSFRGALSDTPLKVQVPIQDGHWCQGLFAEGKFKPKTMLCAGTPVGGKDACQGDSGGPLFTRDPSTLKYLLLGIVSWGEGCGKANKPGVYTRVSAYQPWICAESGIAEACFTARQPKPPPAPPSPPSPPMFPTSVITVNVLTDAYPGEVSWQLLVSGVVAVVSSSVTGGNYSVRSGECYVFRLRDSFGDGMCCEYGMGSYEVSMDGVKLFGGLGTFTEELVVPFGLNCKSPPPPAPRLPPSQTESPSPPPKVDLVEWVALPERIYGDETLFDFEQSCSRACYADSACAGFINIMVEADRELICQGGPCCELYKLPAPSTFGKNGGFFKVTNDFKVTDDTLSDPQPQHFIKRHWSALPDWFNPDSDDGDASADSIDGGSSAMPIEGPSDSSLGISPGIGVVIFAGLFFFGLITGYLSKAFIGKKDGLGHAWAKLIGVRLQKSKPIPTTFVGNEDSVVGAEDSVVGDESRISSAVSDLVSIPSRGTQKTSVRQGNQSAPKSAAYDKRSSATCTSSSSDGSLHTDALFKASSVFSRV